MAAQAQATLRVLQEHSGFSIGHAAVLSSRMTVKTLDRSRFLWVSAKSSFTRELSHKLPLYRPPVMNLKPLDSGHEVIRIKPSVHQASDGVNTLSHPHTTAEEQSTEARLASPKFEMDIVHQEYVVHTFKFLYNCLLTSKRAGTFAIHTCVSRVQITRVSTSGPRSSHYD